ncbi:SAG family member [Eimeria mitis]|uniref:SAG family member n=1 Tax=Eimeria mitis TaxID=44415 RepID=U6KGZ0_9EIME|nr:SAG family member [Eimeria mitis]CDJ34723.1 SAG family member [Eimeria mitis]
MAALKVFSLASASAFLMANAVHQTAKQTSLTPSPASPTYTVDLDGTTVCLDEINAAREAAGLKHFLTESQQLTWPPTTVQAKQQHNTAWNPVCKALIAEETEQLESSSDENGFKSGTYAYMALESATPDCAAAVSHWKDALSNFTTIPPAKNDEGKLYDKQQNISFVALYNPQENAAADCRVVTCTLPAASTSTPGTVNFRSTEKDKHGYALLCMTTPEALKDDEAPFTEEQWKKIKASITGSASAAAPSLLAVAIAALGLVAL